MLNMVKCWKFLGLVILLGLLMPGGVLAEVSEEADECETFSCETHEDCIFNECEVFSYCSSDGLCESDFFEEEWEYFVDYDYDFRILILRHWEMELITQGVREIVEFRDLESGYEGNDYLVLSIAVMPNQGGLILAEWWEEQEAQGSLYVKSEETLLIGGLEAYKLNPGEGTEAGPRYIFMNLPGEGGYIFDISITGLEVEMRDAIIASLQFMSCRDEYYECGSGMSCCDGLVEISYAEEYGGECLYADCGSICSPCGNGECDYFENWCNCPEDCEALPTWTDEDEVAFLEGCVISATEEGMLEEVAQEQCICVLEKLELLYSSPEGVLNMTYGAMLELSAECVQDYFVFLDVGASNPYYEAISYVKNEEIVSGYEDTTYKPENSINRAEFTKIIMGAVFDIDEIEGCISETEFQDVADEEWYAQYVCKASNEGIIQGYEDGTFKPGDNINFVEAAKIIVKAFDYETLEREVWYEPFVEVLYQKKAIPTAIDAFDKEITRGEMAEMIFRLREEIVHKEYTIFTDGELWKTYVNSADGYSIQYAPEFSVQRRFNLANYDIRKEENDGDIKKIIFEIQKKKWDPKFESMQLFMKSLEGLDEPVTQHRGFADIHWSQFTRDEGEDTFISFFGYKAEDDKYYEIMVLEPGYSENQNLVYEILGTFRIR